MSSLNCHLESEIWGEYKSTKGAGVEEAFLATRNIATYYSSLDGMLVHCKVTQSILLGLLDSRRYSWVKRDNVE